MFIKLLKFIIGVPSANKFIYKNLFEIIKYSLKTLDEDDSFDSLKKIENNPILRNQFSKVFSNAYLDHLSSARSRDAKVVGKKGGNFRADFMFYTIVITFLLTSFGIIFLRHRISPDVLAIMSALMAFSGGCLKEVFSFEFGNSNSITYKSSQYILDEADQK